MKVFEYASSMGHEQVVYCHDASTGLKAIIAVHDTTLGPALGGCRFWNYDTEEQALFDVLRLSRGMTYKAAVAGLNLGGGKAVILGNPKALKSEALFRSFGRFVQSLCGRYITAEDVNIHVADMEHVALETRYVTGLSSHNGSGDPSPVTALGVYHGIRASARFKLGLDSLKGLRIAVQGCGAVGRNLLQLLHRDGAKLCIADISAENLKLASAICPAEIVDPNKIHAADVDLFAPCALGAIINDETIPEIKATIIAGGANNQLLDEKKHGEILRQRGILHAPDYVINAGGLINVSHELRGYNREAALAEARKIEEVLMKVFQLAKDQSIPTQMASDKIAESRIAAVKASKQLNQTYESQLWIRQS